MDALRRLAAREMLRERVAIVVAHPDDETIAAGGSLYLMPGLVLVHVTDGAPVRLGDAGRAGFATTAAYAAARAAELDAALAVAGVSPLRVGLGVPDQDASLHMPGIVAALHALFRRHAVQVVLTHAYEGGHPDHDAVAFAVHRAADGLGVLEFPAYRAGDDGSTVVQLFPPGPPETLVHLGAEDAARKRAMLGVFRSQAGVLAAFDAGTERFRAAPAHDFGVPPHEGRLNYEAWGWEMTGVRWRGLAAAAGRACAA